MKQKRKYFGTDGIRGKVGDALVNPEFILKLGWAVGRVLANSHRSKVLIGKDTRISGYMLESALEAGLSAAGVDSHLLGPMPTPGIAYLTRTLRARAGIVISASHNRFEDNGIKFFSADGFKLPDAIEQDIETELDKPMTVVDSSLLGKASRIKDAAGRYIEFCKSTIASRTRLNGLKIVVDCAHGATYHIAPEVFVELGADVISIGTHPDGFNINEQCGSTNPEFLRQQVILEHADLGIALDGDGDRLIMVDNKGEVLDGDDILFIMINERIKNKRMHGGVVGTAMTNLGLELALQKLNIEFARSGVGDRYVMAELLKRKWILGGETSGHIICLEHTTTGDGIISALQVLFAMCDANKTLHELKSGFSKCPQAMINIKVEDQAKAMSCTQVKNAIKDVEKKLNGSGRVLIRPSGTEPLIRVMVEAQDATEVDAYSKQIAQAVTDSS